MTRTESPLYNWRNTGLMIKVMSEIEEIFKFKVVTRVFSFFLCFYLLLGRVQSYSGMLKLLNT